MMLTPTCSCIHSFSLSFFFSFSFSFTVSFSSLPFSSLLFFLSLSYLFSTLHCSSSFTSSSNSSIHYLPGFSLPGSSLDPASFSHNILLLSHSYTHTHNRTHPYFAPLRFAPLAYSIDFQPPYSSQTPFPLSTRYYFERHDPKLDFSLCPLPWTRRNRLQD